ncbi:MAG: phosphoadenylyl-sulfate reductase [Alphaproteobacteria bacterium]
MSAAVVSRAPDVTALQASIEARAAGLDATGLLQLAIKELFPGRIACVSSFGAESAVLLHLMASVDPTVPVIFLNTGKLFGETLRYRDRLQEAIGLQDVRAIGPDGAAVRAKDPDGVLWRSDPDACCAMRKVDPVQRALKGFDAEITGRKRFQTLTRGQLGPVEFNGVRHVINPLWNWTLDDLRRHIEAHALPRHPLVEDGFVSIGCMPCTSRVAPGGDYRSGRWAGTGKDECGIHANVDGDGI